MFCLFVQKNSAELLRKDARENTDFPAPGHFSTLDTADDFRRTSASQVRCR